MRLKEFVKNYDLYDITINKTLYKDGNIYLSISFDRDFHFIANGCRSAFDDPSCHIFMFPCQKEIDSIDCIQFVKNFSYANETLILELTYQTILINECIIKIYSNK